MCYRIILRTKLCLRILLHILLRNVIYLHHACIITDQSALQS